MAEGLLVLGDYDLTAYWHIESHDFGSENLSFQTMDTGLEVFDTDVSEGQVESTWILSPQRPTTWAAIQSNYRSLVAELRKQTNELQLRGPNTDEIFTYDTFRSPVPSLFSTDGAAASVTHNVQLELVIRRRPYARTDTLLAEVQKLSNPWPLKEGATAGRPLNWTVPITTNITNESIDDDGAHATIATTAARNWQQTTAVGSFGVGDVVTMSFYVEASAASIARARAAVQFKQADGTTNVGSEHIGTLTPVTTTLARVSVTTSAAGALTSRALVSIRFENSAATAVNVNVQRFQAELASTASEYRMGIETLVNDPAGFCVLPVWNPGDTDARADIVLGSLSIAWRQMLMGLHSGSVADYINYGKFLPSSDASGELLRPASSSDTTRTTGIPLASAGDTLTTSFATVTALADRVSWVGDGTVPGTPAYKRFTSLRGRSWLVMGRYASTAISTTYQLRIQYGHFHNPDGTSGRISGETIVWTPATANTFYDIPLGYVPIGENESQHTIYFQAGRTSGTGSLRLDHVYLVPTEGQVVVDNTGNLAFAGINAHRSPPVTIRHETFLDQTIGPVVSQGEVPVVPPGLSCLFVQMWRTKLGEELQGKAKEHVLADTIFARADITPQRHQ